MNYKIRNLRKWKSRFLSTVLSMTGHNFEKAIVSVYIAQHLCKKKIKIKIFRKTQLHQLVSICKMWGFCCKRNVQSKEYTGIKLTRYKFLTPWKSRYLSSFLSDYSVNVFKHCNYKHRKKSIPMHFTRIMLKN